MRQGYFTVLENAPLARGCYDIVLRGDCSAIERPGQFVNIAIPGFYLRRPISVCSVKGEILTLVYKTVGAGTLALANIAKGERLELLTGLGNGFDTSGSFERPLLIGGGAGAAPLYELAKSLVFQRKAPTALLGFNTADEIFLARELTELGAAVSVATMDGSAGVKGFVTDALARLSPEYDYVFACGPEPMLKAVYDATSCAGQYSFEERMACGVGACMGCSCETKYGAKRICRDGPVLERDEILW